VSSLRYACMLLSLLLPPPPLPLPPRLRTPRNMRGASLRCCCHDGTTCLADDAITFFALLLPLPFLQPDAPPLPMLASSPNAGSGSGSGSDSGSSASSGIAAKDAGILKGSEKLRRCVLRFFFCAAAPSAAPAAGSSSSTSTKVSNVEMEGGADLGIRRLRSRGESANALIWFEVGSCEGEGKGVVMVGEKEEEEEDEVADETPLASPPPTPWPCSAPPLNENARSSRIPARLNICGEFGDDWEDGEEERGMRMVLAVLAVQSAGHAAAGCCHGSVFCEVTWIVGVSLDAAVVLYSSSDSSVQLIKVVEVEGIFKNECCSAPCWQ